MNDLLRPYLRKFALVFFDDILIYSATVTSHLTHLATVLQILCDNQLVANVNKCQFGTSQIEYLGHIVSAQGVPADPVKVTAIQV